MTRRTNLWTTAALTALALAFVATAAPAHRTAGDLGDALHSHARLVLVLRGELDATLTDPLGRVNAVQDTGEYAGIPGCQRNPAWRDPGLPKDAAAEPAMAFEVSDATVGLYAIRLRAHQPSTIVLEAKAIMENGTECRATDRIRLLMGERGTFSILFEPNEKADDCAIEAAHRHAAPPKKKEKKD